ncbi:MAG: sulfatase, partial [Verrucomicrobiota bacterium]
DDMSADSIGVFGCELEGTSPNVDKLASEGIRFDKAHVQVGNCFPSRNVLFSGLFPHTTGGDGFYQVRDFTFQPMCDLMQGAGYYVAIRGKVSHSTPYQPYHWDADLTIQEDGTKEHIKDVPSYGRSTRRGIEAAAEAGKPFVLNINISDPHKPFWKPGDKHPASREFTAAEVPVPGFLFEDSVVREELALYYTSVRRADDAVGEILKAIEETGHKDDTIVFFLSDHGMPLPFAKTQLYHHSTRTPWIVRWPGVSPAGALNTNDMISAVDLVPTLCEIVGIETPQGLAGASFLRALEGKETGAHRFVIKSYAENSGGVRHPMRAIETPDYLYIFNPWSNGERAFKTATQGTATYKRMRELAESDEAIAARLALFDHRVLEEFYDVRADPDCLINLVDHPDHAEALASHRRKLRRWMKEHQDPILAAFELRNDLPSLDAMMDEIEAEAKARRAEKRKKKKAKG